MVMRTTGEEEEWQGWATAGQLFLEGQLLARSTWSLNPMDPGLPLNNDYLITLLLLS